MTSNEQPSNPKPLVQDDQQVASPVPPQQLIDESKRHFALKEYSLSIEKLADALEQLREQHGEDADLLAPLLHLYGRSLLENFILHSAALGGGGSGAGAGAGTGDKPSKQQQQQQQQPTASSSSSSQPVTSDPRFSFSGDGDEEEEEDQNDDNQNVNDVGGGDGDENDDDDDDDDLGVAFTVLDLARVIYQRVLSCSQIQLITLDGQTWNPSRIQAELAEVMNDLGDVGLESEIFQQASEDYSHSLEILTPLLHSHSRRLADAHLRLGLALEFHPDVSQRKGAIQHIKQACLSLASRLEALKIRKQSLSSSDHHHHHGDSGKGKSKLEKDDLFFLTHPDQIDREVLEISEMKSELDTKLEEYESSILQQSTSTSDDVSKEKDVLKQVLSDAFGFSSSSSSSSGSTLNQQVNDLNRLVKRKNKPSESTTPTVTKKTKLDEENR